mmetsp:Transcript_32878/g.76785  ORF Transcript_32878/g.76785 Transcript_32878/m.76785 type:complete len:153 (+) Transcript_32878:111-569(+)
MTLTLDETVAEYKVLILDLLKETSRPTVKVLLAGCLSLFPEASRDFCKPWCEKLVNAISHCRSKRSCTSGKKRAPAVYEVVMFLKGGGNVARDFSRTSFSSFASRPGPNRTIWSQNDGQQAGYEISAIPQQAMNFPLLRLQPTVSSCSPSKP